MSTRNRSSSLWSKHRLMKSCGLALGWLVRWSWCDSTYCCPYLLVSSKTLSKDAVRDKELVVVYCRAGAAAQAAQALAWPLFLHLQFSAHAQLHVALWTSNLWTRAWYYGVINLIKASYRDLSNYFCKATPAMSFQRETLGSRLLCKEAVSQPGLRSGLGFTTAKCSAIYPCVKAFKELKMPVRNAEDAFVTRGFHNWKLATTSFHQPMKLVLPTRRLWRDFTLPARYWWGSYNGSCSGMLCPLWKGLICL